MTTLIVVLHVIVCILLVLIVLLQAGKGADLGASFGAGSSDSVLGTGAAPFLTKLTSVLAILFMITSITLTIFHRQKSVTDVPKTTKIESGNGVKPTETPITVPAMPLSPQKAPEKSQPLPKKQ